MLQKPVPPSERRVIIDQPIDPALPSQEVLRDLEKESALIQASDERPHDSASIETYDYCWFLSLSVRKVATHFSIFLFFFDAFNICLAFRDKYLEYQLLYFLSICGPIIWIFGVNVETYYSLTFVIAYFTTILRIIVAGVLSWLYYEGIEDAQKKQDEYQNFLNLVEKGDVVGIKEQPQQNRHFFRTKYSFAVLIGICVFIVVLQIWAMAVAIPRSNAWKKKKAAIKKLQSPPKR